MSTISEETSEITKVVVWGDIIIPIIGILLSLTVATIAIVVSLTTQKQFEKTQALQNKLALSERRSSVWAGSAQVLGFINLYSKAVNEFNLHGLHGLLEYFKISKCYLNNYLTGFNEAMIVSKTVSAKCIGLFDEDITNFIFQIHGSFSTLGIFLYGLLKIELTPQYLDSFEFKNASEIYDYLVKMSETTNPNSELNIYSKKIEKYLDVSTLGILKEKK